MSLAHALAAQCPAQPRRAKDVEMQPGRVPGVGCRVWLGFVMACESNASRPAAPRTRAKPTRPKQWRKRECREYG